MPGLYVSRPGIRLIEGVRLLTFQAISWTIFKVEYLGDFLR